MGNAPARHHDVTFDLYTDEVLDFIESGDRLGPLPSTSVPFYEHLTGVYLRDELVGFFHRSDAPASNEDLFAVIRNLRKYNVHLSVHKDITKTLESSPEEIEEGIRGKSFSFKRVPRCISPRPVPNGLSRIAVERAPVRHAILGAMVRMFDLGNTRHMFLKLDVAIFEAYLKKLRNHTQPENIMDWDNDVVLRIVRHFDLYASLFSIFGSLSFVARFLPAEIRAFLDTPIWFGDIFKYAFDLPVIDFEAMIMHMNVDWPEGRMDTLSCAREELRLRDQTERSEEGLLDRPAGPFHDILSRKDEHFERDLLQVNERFRAHDIVFTLFHKK